MGLLPEIPLRVGNVVKFTLDGVKYQENNILAELEVGYDTVSNVDELKNDLEEREEERLELVKLLKNDPDKLFIVTHIDTKPVNGYQLELNLNDYYVALIDDFTKEIVILDLKLEQSRGLKT